MHIERWLVFRMHDATLWQVEPYHADQKPVEARFTSLQLAATALADGAPVSIEGPTETGLGEYAIVRVTRGNDVR